MLVQMDDLASQIARRDHFLRSRWRQLPIAERIREIAKQQQKSWDLLQLTPKGYEHFLRRNFKARAIKPFIPSDESRV